MHKVGKKHYPYTAKGKAAAKVARKRKGVVRKSKSKYYSGKISSFLSSRTAITASSTHG